MMSWVKAELEALRERMAEAAARLNVTVEQVQQAHVITAYRHAELIAAAEQGEMSLIEALKTIVARHPKRRSEVELMREREHAVAALAALDAAARAGEDGTWEQWEELETKIRAIDRSLVAEQAREMLERHRARRQRQRQAKPAQLVLQGTGGAAGEGEGTAAYSRDSA